MQEWKSYQDAEILDLGLGKQSLGELRVRHPNPANPEQGFTIRVMGIDAQFLPGIRTPFLTVEEAKRGALNAAIRLMQAAVTELEELLASSKK